MTSTSDVALHASVEDAMLESSSSATRRWRAFLADRWTGAAVVVLLLLVCLAALAPWIAPYDPVEPSEDLLVGPGAGHLLGTDELGRDLASRLLYGARISLLVAFGSAAVGLAVGVPVGIVAGYIGGWADSLPMRAVDLLLAVPNLLLALVIVTVLGSSEVNLILAIGVASVPAFARLSRASVLAIRDREFVVASRAMGATRLDTMVRTIFPNILAPLIVQFVVTASIAVVVAAGLSFLGLGPPPPAPSWGSMLKAARSFLYENYWYGLLPGLALTLTVLCLDRVGHGLQHAFGSMGGSRQRMGGA